MTFDFDAYFANGCASMDLDLERLGRYHQNKLSGGKRKRASRRRSRSADLQSGSPHRSHALPCAFGSFGPR